MPTEEPTRLIKLQCPYCAAEVAVGFRLPKLKGRSAALAWEPRQVECVPYTRDIGKFDPKPGQDPCDPDLWSAIGQDFLPELSRFLKWERIGVLRVTHPGIRVLYRGQQCLACERLYDVYLNCSERLNLADFWPHVFGAAPDDERAIRPYAGRSWPIFVIDRLGDWVGRLGRRKVTAPGGADRSLGVVVLGVLLFAGSLVGWLFPGSSLWAGGLPAELLFQLIVRGLAAYGMLWVFVLAYRYVDYMQTTPAFADLFAVRERRGVTHWQNYTLCRFVGVQTGADGELTAWPQLTQVDIIAGGMATLSLVGLWLIYGPLTWPDRAATLAVLMGLFGLLALVLRFAPARAAGRWAALLAALTLAAGFGLAAAGYWRHVNLGLDLAFWLATAHVLATATWLALNSALYVLEGVQRIPMRLSPYDRFAALAPLRQLQRFSTRSMLVLLLNVLAIVSVLLVSAGQPQLQAVAPAYQWLLHWLRWVLVLLLVGVGFGFLRGFLLIAGLYFVLEAWLFTSVNASLLVMGAFFGLLAVYHYLSTDRVISQLVADVKAGELQQVDRQIMALRPPLSGAEAAPPAWPILAGLLAVRTYLVDADVAVTTVRGQSLRLGSLVLTSFILPEAWSRMVALIFGPGN